MSWWMRVLENAKFTVACLLCMVKMYVPTSVQVWQKTVREGRTSLQDDLRPEQARRAIKPDVIARIDGLVNRRITEKQICVYVTVSHRYVHAIIKNHLQFRKKLRSVGFAATDAGTND